MSSNSVVIGQPRNISCAGKGFKSPLSGQKVPLSDGTSLIKINGHLIYRGQYESTCFTCGHGDCIERFNAIVLDNETSR